MLALKGRERPVGHAGMAGWPEEYVGNLGQSQQIRCCLLTLKVGTWSARGHKDHSNVPLISWEAELSGLFRGHTI